MPKNAAVTRRLLRKFLALAILLGGLALAPTDSKAQVCCFAECNRACEEDYYRCQCGWSVEILGYCDPTYGYYGGTPEQAGLCQNSLSFCYHSCAP